MFPYFVVVISIYLRYFQLLNFPEHYALKSSAVSTAVVFQDSTFWTFSLSAIGGVQRPTPSHTTVPISLISPRETLLYAAAARVWFGKTAFRKASGSLGSSYTRDRQCRETSRFYNKDRKTSMLNNSGRTDQQLLKINWSALNLYIEFNFVFYLIASYRCSSTVL